MSHLSDTTDWAWNMTPALFPVKKTVKYRDWVKKALFFPMYLNTDFHKMAGKRGAEHL